MIKIKIIGDSTCDLSAEILEEYDISIAPLTVNISGIEYKDKVNIDIDWFYNHIEEFESHPKTSMPSPKEYLKLFENAVADGENEIICICMSSGTSGAYQSAVVAEDLFYKNRKDSGVKIAVIDSRSMSHGSGWLIMKAAMLREEGCNFEHIIDFLEKYKMKVKHYLSVDDLDHLIKSGRLSNAGAFIGKILNLKPIMSMKNGKGKIVGKERGRKRVLRHYLQGLTERIDKKISNFIIIGYTSDKSYAENLKAMILDKEIFAGQIYLMQMGVVVGTHVGLGAISLFFVEK